MCSCAQSIYTILLSFLLIGCSGGNDAEDATQDGVSEVLPDFRVAVFSEAIEGLNSQLALLRASEDERLNNAIEHGRVSYLLIHDPEGLFFGPPTWDGHINGVYVSFWRTERMAISYVDEDSGWRVYQYIQGTSVHEFLVNSELWETN